MEKNFLSEFKNREALLESASGPKLKVFNVELDDPVYSEGDVTAFDKADAKLMGLIAVEDDEYKELGGGIFVEARPNEKPDSIKTVVGFIKRNVDLGYYPKSLAPKFKALLAKYEEAAKD